MKLSPKTREKLAEMITGDSKLTPYRSVTELTYFFQDFDQPIKYSQRREATLHFLQQVNKTDFMEEVIEHTFDFEMEKTKGLNPSLAAEVFNLHFKRDGYSLIVDVEEGSRPYIKIKSVDRLQTIPDGLGSLDHSAVQEQIQKITSRIDSGDFSGSLASSYTLCEEMFKIVLTHIEHEHDFSNKGDLKKLYEPVRVYYLQGEELQSFRRRILDTSSKLVSAVYDYGNKASDRHARVYEPSNIDAHLVKNVTFAMCEFFSGLINRQEESEGFL